MKVAEKHVRRGKNGFLSELSGLLRLLWEPCCFRGKQSESAGTLSWSAEAPARQTATMIRGVECHPGKTARKGVETMKVYELRLQSGVLTRKEQEESAPLSHLWQPWVLVPFEPSGSVKRTE